MRIEFSEERVLKVVEPYLERVLNAGTPEARALLAGQRRATLKAALRSLLMQRLGRKRRGKVDVERIYAESYGTDLAQLEASFSADGRVNPYHFSGRVLMMPTAAFVRVYLDVLETALAALRPASVTEVGFGSGKNLIFLAPRFPEVAFSGFELAESGVQLAKALQAMPSLPPELVKLIGNADSGAAEAVRRIDFRQGNAVGLPAADKSTDLTMTVLALEQMADVLPKALAEIRRITRRHAIFLEPFRDVNDYVGRLHLLSNNYFRSSKAELAAAGFRPIAMISNLPNKIRFSAALLVTEVI